jgi:hypothetical protein
VSERAVAALRWIQDGSIPTSSGGRPATADELAEFAYRALKDPGPHEECDYCRGDGFGCPACDG